ncbi:MAG: hypothetical protein KDD27_08210 [Saprospiraceae bacterium]|nr:hypothetical protein [Saprospiraceae bacterium]
MATRKKQSSLANNNVWTAAAIIVSFCALAVSIYQAIILRNQQYAAVWPYIEPTVRYSNHSFELLIQNKGTGPAIIKKVNLTLDDQPVADYRKFMGDLLGNHAFQSLSITSVDNSVISANESVRMLAAELPDSLSISSSDFPQRTTVKICFCSIFGDCWTYLDGDVKRVRDCK